MPWWAGVDEDPMSLEAPAESFLAAALGPRRRGGSPIRPISASAGWLRRCARCATPRSRCWRARASTWSRRAPDLSERREIFKTLRAAGFAAGLRQEYEEQRDQLKPEVDLEHRAWPQPRRRRYRPGRARPGPALSPDAAASCAMYDLLLVPAAILPPFDVKTRWIREWRGWSSTTTSNGSGSPMPSP